MTWSQTLTGKKFDFLNLPDPKDINWFEIATVLSRLPRFNGHTNRFLSVGEHSINCYYHLLEHKKEPIETAVYALIHDGHEWAAGDMTTPMKMLFKMLVPDAYQLYKGLTESIDKVLYASLGLREPDDDTKALIREADLSMLKTERDTYMMKPPEPWGAEYEAAEVVRTPSMSYSWMPGDLTSRQIAYKFMDLLTAAAPIKPVGTMPSTPIGAPDEIDMLRRDLKNQISGRSPNSWVLDEAAEMKSIYGAPNWLQHTPHTTPHPLTNSRYGLQEVIERAIERQRLEREMKHQQYQSLRGQAAKSPDQFPADARDALDGLADVRKFFGKMSAGD